METTILIVAIATFINLVVIYVKIQMKKYEHAIVDAGLFMLIVYLFNGSVAGMQVGMIASALMSIFLLIFPPKLEFI